MDAPNARSLFRIKGLAPSGLGKLDKLEKAITESYFSIFSV
jgi:hypothetical protein